MAGHSQFANIKHRKDRQDAKKAKIFTKLQREITVAAKLGSGDIEFNARLRSAVIAARAQNMPKDKIEAAIKRGSGANDGDNFETIRYEAYGSGGIAFIIEALTDNRNRTAGEIRSILTKSGGRLAESGAVSFMFDHIGLIEYEGKIASEEEIFEAALEAGADEVESDAEWHNIICAPNNFSTVRDILMKKFGDPQSAKLDWMAKNLITIDGLENAQKIIKLVDNLEDNDDVQLVAGNYFIPNEIWGKE